MPRSRRGQETPQLKPLATAPRTIFPDNPGNATRYNRKIDLPRLISIWPEELRPGSENLQKDIVRRLRAALRAERRRGLAGHWSYDLARHSQLLTAYREEQKRLAAHRQAD
ncbi:MAG: hypothetical protein KDJ47_06780 [Hyphomicrobiaceae bacterium]|nr:hypothetical protein [Hyphomicrobiaceae bacterium]